MDCFSVAMQPAKASSHPVIGAPIVWLLSVLIWVRIEDDAKGAVEQRA